MPRPRVERPRLRKSLILTQNLNQSQGGRSLHDEHEKAEFYRFEMDVKMLTAADVLVAGRAIAGSSAAIAAARQGAEAMLIEEYAILGGTAAVCGVDSFCGETTGQGEVFDNIAVELRKFGAIPT